MALKQIGSRRHAILLWAMVPQTIIMPLAHEQSWGGDLTLANLLGAIRLDKRACAVVTVSLLMLALTAGVVSAQGPMPPPMPAERQSEAATTPEQMHQMMDAMHGEGTRQRMHEAMGDDAERMMAQCSVMMSMMGGMRGMMGDDAMPGMMSEPGRDSMSDMTQRMMGR